MTTVEDAGILESPDASEPEAAAPSTARPRRRRMPRATKPVAALCAVTVLTGAGYQSWFLYQHHRSDVAAREALDAAAKYAVILTTASPDTIDRQITEILFGSTGDFHSKYAKQSSELRAMLIANRVTTHGSVVNSAVKSADAGNATVLLFVEQSFTSAALPDTPAMPPPEVTGMAITLQKTAGRWLVSDVNAGPQQQ